MAADEGPSKQLVMQRLRNRAMESLAWLADGDDRVRVAGASEYFNQFYDVIDDDSGWEWRSWSCFTKDEVAALDAVLQIVTTACEETPTMVSEDDLVLWAGRPASVRLHLQRSA